MSQALKKYCTVRLFFVESSGITNCILNMPISYPWATNCEIVVAQTMKRSCLGGALIIYLLSYLLAVQLSNSFQNLANDRNLEALMIDTNQVVINPNASSLKSNLKGSFKMAPALKLTQALCFFNIMLAAYLIFLSNDVVLNSGPIDLRVSSQGRGITIGQWNIQHLTDAKFEQLSLSFNAHKDTANKVDVLILSKTFCSIKKLISSHREAFRCNYTGDCKNLGKNCVTSVTCQIRGIRPSGFYPMACRVWALFVISPPLG